MRPDSPPTRSHSETTETAGGGEHASIPQEGATVEEEELSQNASQTPPLKMGDIEVGLREAEVVVECSYRTHPVHQSYMEPQSVTVAPGPSGHHLVIWPSTQGLFNVRSAVASALKMPDRQLRAGPVNFWGDLGGRAHLLEPVAQ